MIFFKKDLIGLNPDGSPCEVCGKHMHEHDWADVASGGKVTWCNIVNDVSIVVEEANELGPEQSEGIAPDQESAGMVSDEVS